MPDTLQYNPDNLTLANSHFLNNSPHYPVRKPLTVYVKLPLYLHAQLINMNFPRILVRIIWAILYSSNIAHY